MKLRLLIERKFFLEVPVDMETEEFEKLSESEQLILADELIKTHNPNMEEAKDEEELFIWDWHKE